MTHQAIGHLHLVLAFLPPLLLAALVDVLKGPYRAVTSVRLGLLGAAQLLTGEELLAMTAIAGAVISLILLSSRPRTALRSWRSSVHGLAVAGFTFSAVAGFPLLFQLFGPRQQYGCPFAFDVFKNDLTGFVTPDRLDPLHSLASSSTLLAGNPEHNAFLGWPLLLLATALLIQRWDDLRVRAIGATAVVLGVFSLGGTLRAGGTDTHVHLPWSMFEQWPLLEGLLPNRFGILVAGLVGLLLAIATDLALDRVPARRIVPPLAIVVLVLLAPLTPHVLLATERPPTPYLISSGLSHRYLPTGSTVLALPFATSTDPRRWTGRPTTASGGRCQAGSSSARRAAGTTVAHGGSSTAASRRSRADNLTLAKLRPLEG